MYMYVNTDIQVYMFADGASRGETIKIKVVLLHVHIHVYPYTYIHTYKHHRTCICITVHECIQNIYLYISRSICSQTTLPVERQ